MRFNYLNGKLRFFIRFLMIVLGSTRGFFQLTFFVTSSCNAKCIHCFNWESLNSAKNELTLDEISEITKRIPFLMSLIVSGGEPFLRKDLDLVIERFYKDTDVANVSIPTNGILSEQVYKTTLSILNKCGGINLSVSLSIDALEEKHDSISGINGSFSKVLNTYTLLKELKKDFPGFRIGVITCLHSENVDNAKKIYNYVLKNMAYVDSFTYTYLRGTTKVEGLKLSVEDYRDLNEYLQANPIKHERKIGKIGLLRRLVRDAINHIRSQSIIEFMQEGVYPYICQAGKLDVVLREEGSIFPCELLNEKLGNVRDFDFDIRKCLNGQKAKQIYNKIVTERCACTHECNLSTNIIVNKRKWLQIGKDILRKWNTRTESLLETLSQR